MAEWITDRLPTALDVIEYSLGQVRIPYGPDCDYAITHYSLVAPGQPWWSPNAAANHAPAAEPAPAAGKPGVRKVVQIAILPFGGTEERTNISCLFALCNDGTIWVLPLKNPLTAKDWIQLPPPPQPEAE